VSSKSGEKLTVVNPYDESIVTTDVEIAGQEDIDLAVAAAQAAFTTGPWATYGGAQRARLMNKLAELIDEHAEELAYLDAVSMGMPVAINAGFTIPETANIFRCECNVPVRFVLEMPTYNFHRLCWMDR
jgi:aldehyde dehydrogenase (NAD+)